MDNDCKVDNEGKSNITSDTIYRALERSENILQWLEKRQKEREEKRKELNLLADETKLLLDSASKTTDDIIKSLETNKDPKNNYEKGFDWKVACISILLIILLALYLKKNNCVVVQ